MNTVAITGNLTKDIDLRFLNDGTAIAKLSIADNRRKKEGDQWVDGQAHFFDVEAWKEVAQNAAETLNKGDRVLVVGRLDQQQWTADNGDKRSRVVIVAEEITPSLRWATAKVIKAER